MVMSQALLRPVRRGAPASPAIPTVPSAPTGVGLTGSPSNLTSTEIFVPDAPTGVTASPVANAPSAPTNVSLSTVPSSPSSIGLTGQPGTPTVEEVFAPDAPTGVTLTPQSSTDPYFSDVVLLLQDSFTDESLNGLTVTSSGATLDTTGQKYGSAAFSFPNTGNIQVANDPALHLSGDFTIECWAYITNTSQNPCLVARDTSGGRAWVLQHINSTGTMAFSIVGTGGYYFSNTTPTPTNQWFHVAACRQGSTLYTSIDGVVTSQTVGTGMPNVATPVWVGRQGSFGNQLNGKVDSLRITKGIARYTSNFTPPTTAFPN